MHSECSCKRPCWSVSCGFLLCGVGFVGFLRLPSVSFGSGRAGLHTGENGCRRPDRRRLSETCAFYGQSEPWWPGPSGPTGERAASTAPETLAASAADRTAHPIETHDSDGNFAIQREMGSVPDCLSGQIAGDPRVGLSAAR